MADGGAGWRLSLQPDWRLPRLVSNGAAVAADSKLHIADYCVGRLSLLLLLLPLGAQLRLAEGRSRQQTVAGWLLLLLTGDELAGRAGDGVRRRLMMVDV